MEGHPPQKKGCWLASITFCKKDHDSSQNGATVERMQQVVLMYMFMQQIMKPDDTL